MHFHSLQCESVERETHPVCIFLPPHQVWHTQPLPLIKAFTCSLMLMSNKWLSAQEGRLFPLFHSLQAAIIWLWRHKRVCARLTGDGTAFELRPGEEEQRRATFQGDRRRHLTGRPGGTFEVLFRLRVNGRLNLQLWSFWLAWLILPNRGEMTLVFVRHGVCPPIVLYWKGKR